MSGWRTQLAHGRKPACVVLADKDSAAVRFPSESVSFQAFAAAIHGRCLQFMATTPDIDWGAGE